MMRLLLLLGLLGAGVSAPRAGEHQSTEPGDCFVEYWVCSTTTDWSGTRPDCYETYLTCMFQTEAAD